MTQVNGCRTNPARVPPPDMCVVATSYRVYHYRGNRNAPCRIIRHSNDFGRGVGREHFGKSENKFKTSLFEILFGGDGDGDEDGMISGKESRFSSANCAITQKRESKTSLSPPLPPPNHDQRVRYAVRRPSNFSKRNRTGVIVKRFSYFRNSLTTIIIM